MLGTYFYHEIIRKTIIGFGTLFNNIEIRHQDKNGADISVMKVPLAYGPMQKFLARIEQGRTDLERDIAITLPRMSFELTGITYDPTRKVGVTQSFKALDDNNKIKQVYMPVPYNMDFQLNIFSKLNDDILQIIEQILPFFQPSFSVTVDLVSSIGEKKDIPIVLNNISFTDEYEGDFTTRRALIYTLTFTAKTYLFGPIAENSDGIIRKVQVDSYTSTDVVNARRSVRMQVVPTATKDYNSDGQITETDDAVIQSGQADGDDFGFGEITTFFTTPKLWSPSQGKDVDL